MENLLLLRSSESLISTPADNFFLKKKEEHVYARVARSLTNERTRGDYRG